MITRDYFEGQLIGQKKARNLLSFYYEDFKTTGIFSHCLLIAQKGQGKTKVCKLIADKIARPAFEFSSQVLTLKNFQEQIFEPLILNKPCTLFLDEIHALKQEVSEFLLSLLSPNKENRNVLEYNGQKVVVDFRKFTLLAATTEKQKLNKALVNRFKVISLEGYTTQELIQIMFLSANTIFAAGAEEYIIKYMENNARAAFFMGEEIGRYCRVKNISLFDKEHAKELISILGVFEHGLKNLEIQVLLTIWKGVTNFSPLLAASGLSASALFEIESKLLALRLIYKQETLRKVTDDGIRYLVNNGIVK